MTAPGGLLRGSAYHCNPTKCWPSASLKKATHLAQVENVHYNVHFKMQNVHYNIHCKNGNVHYTVHLKQTNVHYNVYLAKYNLFPASSSIHTFTLSYDGLPWKKGWARRVTVRYRRSSSKGTCMSSNDVFIWVPQVMGGVQFSVGVWPLMSLLIARYMWLRAG